MQTKTLLPLTALIALVAAGPLAWAQDSHETGRASSDDSPPVKPNSSAHIPAPAQ